MSNSDNPFSSPTVVAPEEPPKAKRGLAHIVRRGKKEQAKGSAPNANLVARNVHPEFSDDSIDALITSPALKTPTNPDPEARGSGAMGKAGQLGSYQTGTVDDFTVEEARPEQHKALDKRTQETEVAPPEDPTRGFVLVSSGDDAGRRVGLLEGRTTIGRGLDCDIVLTDATVSRKHAYVERRENVYVVCDMSSGNGTFVNERERDGEVLIVNNDSFRIGNTIITFQGPEAQDEAAATTNWRAQQSTMGVGKKKHRQRTSDEESTVAGKGIVRPPTDLSEDPPTEASTDVVSSVEVTPQKIAPAARRKPTVPPPIPDSKKAVQDKAIEALSSIVNTPTPAPANQTGLGQLPNQTVPPTPSPAIPYPVNQPSPSQPYPPQGNASPPGPHGGPMGMRQGSGGPQLPMPMGGHMVGPGTPPHVNNPYGAPAAYAPQGSGPMAQRPMLAGARPDMMRPAYGQGHAPPRENGKLLIGFISVTLVLVVVGLVATIMGQMDEESAGGALGPDGGAEVAAAGIDGGSEPAASEDSGAAGMIATADPVEASDAAPTVATADEADGSATVASTNPEEGSKDNPEEEGSKDNPEEEGSKDNPEEEGSKETLVVASLIAGNTQLPVATWGNDESFLRAPDIKPTVEPIDPPVLPDPPVVEDPPEDPDPPKVVKNPRNNKGNKTGKGNKGNKTGKGKGNKTGKGNKIRKPRNDGDDDDDDDDDDDPKVASTDVSSAKSAAKAMYKRKDFEEAADRLSDAADTADDKTADKLLDIASGYRKVGTLLASAKREQQSDPTSALKDYKKALSRDKKIGGGAHTRLIRLLIGQVAPRAAKSYMARKQYAEAKKAADDASRFDQDGAVAAVYSSLEKKASSLLRKALKLKKKDPDEAKRMLRDALKFAPKDGEAYEEAKSEIREL